VPRKRTLTHGSEDETPIALTLKVSPRLYLRLSALRARTRKTLQQILTDAVSAYLQQRRGHSSER